MTRYMNNQGTLNAYNICGYEIEQNDRYGYKVCAKVWDLNSWCAFRGLTEWSDEDVISRGEQVPYEIAKYLFPTIAENIEKYINW